MSNPFVSTRVFRGGPLGATTVSVVAHTALVVAAVAPSGMFHSNTHPVRDPGYEPERVHLVAIALRMRTRDVKKPPAHDDARNTTKTAIATPTGVAHGERLIFKPFDARSLPPTDVSFELPAIDLTSRITDSLDFASASLSEIIGQVLGVRHPDPVGGVYTMEAVDKVMSAVGRNPRPLYPASLAASAIEADFVVRFVVDTTGLVREQSVEIQGTPHPYFVASVRRALLQSHFLPAEVDGHVVPQLVSQEFTFRMMRGRRD
ncbi:MAG: TonB family protein [bacterium]